MAWLAQHPDFQKGTAFSLSGHMGSFPAPAVGRQHRMGTTAMHVQGASTPGGTPASDA